VSLAEAMIGAERHRGPDDEGCWSDATADGADNDGAAIALGHVRLSIIDLTDAAAQPMMSADGRYVIVFNGEIYNYRSLRAELADAGVQFRTGSDTEVLLELFARQGPSAVEKLHGIFAFAIWDTRDRTLFLARDPLGVKPLYYAALKQGFLFASELKALTLCRDVPRDIDPVAVGDHLGFLWSAGEATMLKAVRKLRPGCTLTIAGGIIQKQRYYRAPLSSPPGVSASPEALAELIDEVVAEQMVADVEVGALLSGGVDSSAIVASMCRVTDPANITTFCAVVEKSAGGADNFGDDARFAADVAQDMGVRLIEVPTEADLIDALPGMVWALDEPTADFSALQTQFLARAARSSGIMVLMSGVGGDDLFTGYGRHTAALAWAALGRVPGLRSLAAGAMRCFSPGSIRGRRLRRMGDLFAMGEEAMLAEAMSFSAVAGARRRSLLAPGLQGHMPADGIPTAFAESFSATEGLHPVERLLDLELNGFMPDHNLNYTDKMAMQEGVEIRVPLCDPRLVDFAMQLPLSDRIDFRTTKKILRDSQRGRIPDAVLNRAKQGFGVPVRSWLAGPAGPLMEELTSRDVIEARGLFDAGAVAQLREDFLATRIDAAMTLFPLMAIELWCRALDAAPYADGTA
jgi:asparagine synthase (glutamine-hydrolysing)